MPTKSRSRSSVPEAQFVFQGTVQKLRATTSKQVPVSNDTVTVRIDRVLQAPAALSDYAGHEITVRLTADEKVKVGQTFVFHTIGWIFGESVAVQSVGHEEATPPRTAALSLHPDDPVRSLHARETLNQVDRADLIVSGRVSAVRLSPDEAKARATAMSRGRTTEPISEHAPLWQEAVIDIDEVHKGSHKKKQVVVRFPSSTDVRWHSAPKFQTGEEGVFMLHKTQLTPSQAKTAAIALAPEEYTALHAADVQPLDELPRIKMAVKQK